MSKPLRRVRLLRGVLSVLLGLLAGFCLAELIAQLGFGWFYHGSRPWLAGVLSGLLMSLALSAGRSVIRQLRIQLTASRAGYLSLILIGLGVVVAYPSPAVAQASAICEAQVSQGDGPSVSITETTPGRPLEVDPANSDVFRIVWGVPDDAGERLTMVLRANTIGFGNSVHTAEGDDSTGVYFLAPTDVDVPPGVYKISGELIDENGTVCPEAFGYVRILGSPLSKHGLPPAAGLLLGLAGTGLVFRFPRLDLWTFTTPDGLTVDIVDPKDGKTVRGPLLRGQLYVLKTTIDFPDPRDAYADLPAALQVTVGTLTGAGSLAPSQMNPSTGQVSTENSFTVPTVGESMELVTDVSVAGNVVESVRIVEQIGLTTERTRVSSAIGQVIYKAGSWAAADLCSIRPTDATVMLHGNADGSAVEAWAYAGDVAVGRRTGRRQIEVEALSKLSAECRSKIERCIEAGWLLANEDMADAATLETDRDDAVRELAIAGAKLRAELLGEADPVAPFDGVIQVAHDTDVTGSATFPWSTLYEGPEPADGGRVCFEQHPDGHVDHEDGVTCVERFWGLSYEVAWPNGWVPTHGTSERPGLTSLNRVLRRSPNLSLTNLIRNRQAMVIHSVDNAEFADDGIVAKLPTGVAVSRTVGQAAFARSFAELQQEAEIIHLFGHGQIANGNFALALDLPGEQLLDGSDLLRLANGDPFERGPLVFLNACQSGAIARSEHNGVVDALKTLGARAVVVTESRVDADEAIVAITRVLNEVLAGDYVSRAVRSARRESMYQGRDLSSLAFTFYGPCGLRLTNPVV